jgi:hypothetical protein
MNGSLLLCYAVIRLLTNGVDFVQSPPSFGARSSSGLARHEAHGAMQRGLDMRSGQCGVPPV